MRLTFCLTITFIFILSLSGCSTVLSVRPANSIRSVLHLDLKSTGDIGSKEFEKTLDIYTNSKVIAGNSLKVLQNGNHFFPELITEIDKAEETINIAIYDFTVDNIGKKVKDRLIAAVKRGVNVRLTYDKFGCNTKLEHFNDLIATGAKVREFNPVNRWTFLRMNSRNHRKIIVVDHTISFISGINISDPYTGDGFTGWRDSGVKICGPVSYEIEKIFAQTWNQAGTRWFGMNLPLVGVTTLKSIIDYPFIKLFKTDYTPPRKKIAPCGNVAIRIVEQSPEWFDSYQINLFVIAINNAKESVYISTPYFLPPVLIRRAIIAAARRGVDIRILTQGDTDLPLFRELSEGEFYPYIKNGVRIWSWYNSILHNKCAIIDNKFFIGGSVNLDSRSLLMNYEIAYCLEDPELLQELTQCFMDDLAISQENSLEAAEKMKTDKSILFAPLRGQL